LRTSFERRKQKIGKQKAEISKPKQKVEIGRTEMNKGRLPWEEVEIWKAENRNRNCKTEIEKAEMNKGRLSEEFRNRTKKFASATIRLFVKLPKAREEVRVLGKQLLRSGTSVAAHTREASRARSEDEFVSKLGGALQEADESQLWLELLREECAIAPADTLPMEKEADELMAIMNSIINKTKTKAENRN
jgi:four helix bundle protein